MITKTSKEVILHALQLAGVNNIGFMNFFNTVAMLNNEYRKIYEEIATTEDAYYDKECIASGNTIPLPADAWIVKRVIQMNGDREVRDLIRQPGQTTISGQYYIRNNEIVINTIGEPNVKIVYAPQPQTITVPEDPILTNLDVGSIDLATLTMDEDYLYFKDIIEPTFYAYNLNEGTLTTVEDIPAALSEHKYLNGTLSVDNNLHTYVYSEGVDQVDVTDVLSAGKEIEYVVVSNPYIAVTYTDKTINIFNGWGCAEYNMNAYKGKPTLGTIIGMYTNDYTGKGVIYVEDGTNKVFYASFVPDTVLNYPEQADFSLLEWELAANLSQQSGTESEWILNNLKEARVEFEKQLKRMRSSTLRVNNVRGRTYVGML